MIKKKPSRSGKRDPGNPRVRAGDPVERPAGDPVERPAGDPVERPTGDPVERDPGDPVERPGDEDPVLR